MKHSTNHPLRTCSLTQLHQMARLGSNTTPTNDGTREKHNSKKWQNNETKRRPMTTKQSLRNGDQTLKLHHVRTPTLAKVGREMGAKYNTHPRRKVVIYKETWTPGEVTQSFPILHILTLKLRALSQGEKDKRAT